MRILLLMLIVLSTPIVNATTVKVIDRFDSYGRVRWHDEKARLDNLAIQLLRDPKHLGVITVRAGKRSCANEAMAHAVKARNYLVKVRHVPWNRVAFRDLGYADSFEVTFWIFLNVEPPLSLLEYQPPTPEHVIERCDRGR